MKQTFPKHFTYEQDGAPLVSGLGHVCNESIILERRDTRHTVRNEMNYRILTIDVVNWSDIISYSMNILNKIFALLVCNTFCPSVSTHKVTEGQVTYCYR